MQQFAKVETEAASSGIFEALGIDWKILILQIVAFVILVWLLSKYVYPFLMKSVDERQDKIEKGAKAAAEAEKRIHEAEASIEALLKKARTEAADIVATAKSESTALVEKAEASAKSRADRIVAEAHEELGKDVLAARRALEKDTLLLVKQAAGLAVAGVADERLDTAVIKKALEGAKR